MNLWKAVAAFENVKVGDPLDPTTQKGAQVSVQQLKKILNYIQISKNEGAKVAVVGERFVEGDAENGYFMKTTLLVDVTNDIRVAREEIFGPADVVIKFKTIDEVIDMANDSALKSAIIIGKVWGFWYAPLWFIASGYEGIQLVQYIILFMVSIISLSIIMTVFYNLTHNLVITMIIHQFFNYFTAIQLGDRLHTFMVTALLYFIAALVLVNYKGVLFKQQNSSLNNNV